MKTDIPLESLIRTIRGQKILLDSDLAAIYSVPTKRLNEQVKRNAVRFPQDFCFQLEREEEAGLRSQIATSKGRGGRTYLPYAFTEHGALMAANVLNSPEAVKMSVHVIRAFIKQRELLAGQAEILKKLAQMDAKLLKHDDALRVIWRELQPLLAPPPVPTREEIGFHVCEDAPALGSNLKKEVVYIETSFISLLVADPSRDVTVAGNQQVTRDWWHRQREAFVCVTSQETLLEASRGDARQAELRAAVLAGLPVLSTTSEAAALAEIFMSTGALPEAAGVDAVHLAVATLAEADYLLTWNCRHLANAQILRRLERESVARGWNLPKVCTPLELMGDCLYETDDESHS